MIQQNNNIYSLTTAMTSDSFWRSIDILLEKPHVVNKKLWGCKALFKTVCKPQRVELQLPVKCRSLENSENVDEYKKQVFQDLHFMECTKSEDQHIYEVTLIELLPKTYNQTHAFQLVFINKQNTSITFYDTTPENKKQKIIPNFTYCFHLNNDKVQLDTKSTTSKSCQWLKEEVLPQLVKWGEENVINSNESLALVCSEKYYQKYNELKLKYGKEMVKIWPECTDPSKFVYEDVALATYLLLLWEEEKYHLNLNTPQSFVDLGCGNGLLVYILTKEGHRGVGIDVRKRQIWDMYTNVKLEERTITPSDSHLFPGTDWIIGNHSDELTPWIPVIAARSSYKCNFFLLPCCAYNFDGTKYQRQNSSISQYTEYLQYIKQLCKDCGFITDTDRLKIPSTKRICLVGRGRIHTREEYDAHCTKIQQIINYGNNIQKDADTKQWVKDFTPREATERVRNCTQIDKNIVNSIVQEISSFLLEDEQSEYSEWSAGKTVELNDVAQLISQDKLKALKSECGGLQTLLKNNHHIFKVQSGKVQLRYPKTVDEVNNTISKSKNKNKASNIKVQQKPCWFYSNHPKGCPLDDSKCSFLHVK